MCLCCANSPCALLMQDVGTRHLPPPWQFLLPLLALLAHYVLMLWRPAWTSLHKTGPLKLRAPHLVAEDRRMRQSHWKPGSFWRPVLGRRSAGCVHIWQLVCSRNQEEQGERQGWLMTSCCPNWWDGRSVPVPRSPVHSGIWGFWLACCCLCFSSFCQCLCLVIDFWWVLPSKQEENFFSNELGKKLKMYNHKQLNFSLLF